MLTIIGFLGAAISMYCLLRRYTDSAKFSFIGAFVFSFATYRVSQYGHLHIFTIQFLPLAIYYLEELLASRRLAVKKILLFTLFFALNALTSAYLLAVSLIPVGVITLFRLLENLKDRKQLLISIQNFAISVIISSVILLPFLLPYLEVSSIHLVTRDIETVNKYSATLRSFEFTPGENLIWGKTTLEAATTPRYGFGENLLNPGIFTLFLVALGVLLYLKNRSITVLMYLAIFIISVMFTFGPLLSDGTKTFYYYLYYLNPLFRGIRVTPRFFIATMMSLSVLTTLSLVRISDLTSKIGMLGRILLIILACLIFGERLNSGYPMVQSTYFSDHIIEYRNWLESVSADSVIMNMPFNTESALRVEYMISNETTFLRTVDGYSGYTPWATEYLRSMITTLESSDDVSSLLSVVGSIGVNYMVFHLDDIEAQDLKVYRVLMDTQNPVHRDGNLVIFDVAGYYNADLKNTQVDRYLHIEDEIIHLAQRNVDTVPWVNVDFEQIEIELTYSQAGKIVKIENLEFHNLFGLQPRAKNLRRIPLYESPWFKYDQVKAELRSSNTLVDKVILTK